MRDLSLHILDIMQNSTAAQASVITVLVRREPETGMLCILIEDNGSGMDSDLLSAVADPFTTTRTTRKVGLGIPLFKASAEQSGGSFGIASQKGAGTKVTARFEPGHIDRPALGDLAGVITDMSAAAPDMEIKLVLENGGNKFVYDSQEVRQTLGEVPLSEYEVKRWLREYIIEGLKEIFGGVLSEIDI